MLRRAAYVLTGEDDVGRNANVDASLVRWPDAGGLVWLGWRTARSGLERVRRGCLSVSVWCVGTLTWIHSHTHTREHDEERLYSILIRTTAHTTPVPGHQAKQDARRDEIYKNRVFQDQAATTKYPCRTPYAPANALAQSQSQTSVQM